jgi:hypothetical protein
MWFVWTVFLTWAGALEEGHHCWSCVVENLYFTDAHDVELREVGS